MPTLLRGDNMQAYHGYAAKDNDEQSRELDVYSEEILPFFQGINGKLDGMCTKSQIKTTGNNGAFEAEINTTNVIHCIYRDDSSSGATPPLVRKGEQVLIYNYGDNSTWYWKSEGRNDNNRRTDIWRRAISGTLENAPELNDNNSYFIEMDTRKTHRIRISTSKQDGEEFRYLIMLDAGKSQVYIGDDTDNQLFIDSKEHKVGIRNKDESLLMLDKENIIMACNGDVTLTSKSGNIVTESAGSTVINSKEDLAIKSSGSMTQAAGGNMGMAFGGGMEMASTTGQGSMKMVGAKLSMLKPEIPQVMSMKARGTTDMIPDMPSFPNLPDVGDMLSGLQDMVDINGMVTATMNDLQNLKNEMMGALDSVKDQAMGAANQAMDAVKDLASKVGQ